MSSRFEKVWEAYTASWGLESAEAKREAFATCLAAECEYIDPLINAQGWDPLIDYMLDFHDQIPGGHFVTTDFLAHNNRSMAKWQMKDREGTVVGEGVSYGRYNEAGRLFSIAGFYRTPEA